MTVRITKPEINIREKLNDLDFAKVPFQKMPAGSVLQVVNVEIDGGAEMNSTATTWLTTDATIAITPKVTNSKIIVFFSSGVGITAASGGSARVDIELFCEEDAERVYRADYIGNEGISGGTARLQIAGSGVYINNSRIEKNFRVRIRKANGSSSESGIIYYNWYLGSVHTLIAMEIAQ